MKYLLFISFFPIFSYGMEKKIGPEGRARHIRTLDALLNGVIPLEPGEGMSVKAHPNQTQSFEIKSPLKSWHNVPANSHTPAPEKNKKL
jgi:hypothetical protein